MNTSGEEKYKVWLEKKKIGKDIVYFIGGGERSHIGGIVICEPDKKPQIIRLEGHFDDIVLKPIAEKACEKYKTKIVAVGGVHVDNATEDEIKILVQNCRDLLKFI